MSAEQREKFLRAAERVNQLRRELADAEREVDALLSGSSAAKGFPIKGSTLPNSLPAKIMDRLSADPGKSYRAEDFQDLVSGKNALQYVRQSLYRLVKAKKLRQPGRGKFRLKESNGIEREAP